MRKTMILRTNGQPSSHSLTVYQAPRAGEARGCAPSLRCWSVEAEPRAKAETVPGCSPILWALSETEGVCLGTRPSFQKVLPMDCVRGPPEAPRPQEGQRRKQTFVSRPRDILWKLLFLAAYQPIPAPSRPHCSLFEYLNPGTRTLARHGGHGQQALRPRS